MSKPTLPLLLSALLWGCASSGSGHYVHDLHFTGETINDKSSGLYILPGNDQQIVSVSSFYGDFILILPYAHWKFDVTPTYPLMATSPKGNVSLLFERFDGLPEMHLTDIRDNLQKSPFGSITKFEFRFFDSTRVLVTKAEASDLQAALKDVPTGGSRLTGTQIGLYSVKTRSDGTHATYHYSHIFEKVPSEAELQMLVKYATMGFTARFKERSR